MEERKETQTRQTYGMQSHTNVSRYKDAFENKCEEGVSKIEEEGPRCKPLWLRDGFA